MKTLLSFYMITTIHSYKNRYEQIQDFSTNNAKFWLSKLKSKQKILEQYTYRNIDANKLSWGLTNMQRIEALIELDQQK